MRNVLIVAYYFPPLGGIGSVRISEFARHLPRYGWAPTVLAPRNGAYFQDPELQFPEQQVVRTSSWELSRTGKRLLRAGGSDTAPAAGGRMITSVRSLARAALYFPDPQVGWYPPAVASAPHKLRGRHFDAIFSSSFPITAHLIGRNLSRRLKAPLVAEFRDPWSETYDPGSPRYRIASALEASLARSAAGLVMTSPTWAAIHSRKWNCPVAVIPNGHDGVRRASKPPPTATLAYLGTFYPRTQSLSSVWQALVTQQQAGSRSVGRLKFIGELNPSLRSELRHRGLESLVHETGFLPHARALQELSEATLLLLAGPRDARGLLRGHLVAKLFEYLSTDLPILYVGDTACDAAELLRKFPGCYVVGTDDVRGVRRVLETHDGHRYQRDIADLSRSSLTGRLAEVLDSATANQKS